MGSPILSYVVEILHSDAQASSESLTYCDGTDETIITNTQCTIPIGQLRSAPYSLSWGSSVQVRVQAINLYGSSTHSTYGNGAIILTYPDAPVNLAEDLTQKTGTKIGLQWEEGAANGGAVVEDYRISSNQGTGEWVYLYTGVAFTSWVITDLTAGIEYRFKVEARNSFGYSPYSNELIVLSGFTPFKPEAPTTKVVGSNAVIEWIAPQANGSPIEGYRILIRQNDFVTFTEDLTNCDGSQFTIITNTACTVPLETLYAAPYSLSRGFSIFAKVIAYNSYGDSEPSDRGNGGKVVFVPDAPLNLANEPSITNSNQIGIVWEEGLSNGGASVAYYRISYDQGSGIAEWTTLEQEVYTTSYTMVFPVTQGETYSFKVEARNSVGYSSYSNEVQILAG